MKKDCNIASGSWAGWFIIGIGALFCAGSIVADILQKEFQLDSPEAVVTPTVSGSELPLVSETQAPILTNGTFRGWSEHLPQEATYIGDSGVYLICTDPVEMQQGNHYTACTMENGELIPWENHTFDAYLSVLGQSIYGKFEYGARDGNIVITHAPAGQTGNAIRFFHDTSQGIHRVLVGINITFPDGRFLHYPVYLNLKTEEVIDFLAGIDQETLFEVFSKEIYPMVMVGDGKFLLGRQNDNSTFSYFYMDTNVLEIIDLGKMSGKMMTDAILCPDEIICWDNTGEFWSLSLDDWKATVLISAPNVVFSNGTFHSPDGRGSSFFLYRDDAQLLHLYDFLTREDTIVKEPDGRKFEARVFRPWGHGRMLCVPSGNGGYLNLDADTCSFQPIEMSHPKEESLQLWEKAAPGELVFVSDDRTEYYFYKVK